MTRLLYVDDEADIREIVEFALEDEPDLEVRFATSGPEAIRLHASFQPDLILLDVMMPGLDGPGTLRAIRAGDVRPAVPVAFITAKVQREDVTALRALGAVDVIEKPFDPLTLAARVRDLLRLSPSPGTATAARRLIAMRERQQQFAASLQDRMAATTRAWEQLPSSAATPDLLDGLRRLVHGIAGSAGTFGYSMLSDAARRLEVILFSTDGSGQSLARMREPVAQLLEEMRERVDRGPDVATLREAPVVMSRANSRVVYLIEDDPMLSDEIVRQLALFDWKVLSFGLARNAIRALNEDSPAALIVDIGMPEGELAGANLVQSFFEGMPGKRVHRIFISSRFDWHARLAAARAGADVYLRKPLDIGDLAATLSRLVEPRDEPYRVLLIDDDVLLSECHAEMLESAGIRTMVINDPTQVLDAIESFSPELVLLDIYMPVCTGVEVANVLRLDPDLIGLPIVFLSTEAVHTHQAAALQCGADDFLQKPIDGAKLVSTVRARLARFRSLASVMQQDSLTKLLNHSMIKQRLAAEYSRALRFGGPLSVAMLDLDRFKEVNDHYGHPVGDRVIRGLTQMLRNRLRSCDIVGRYGGEEFCIVMPNTTTADAERVLNVLREQFASLSFGADEEFHCAFSGGIAGFDAEAPLDRLLQNADAALYAAKQGGRNRISVFGKPYQ